jgi:2-methylcitrate dehydratase PrpD
VSVEREIAAWAAALRWEDVPPEIRERVETIHLDALASGHAGRTRALTAQAAEVARAFAGDEAAARTFVRAYEITAATVCDVYRPGHSHVTPVVVPPLEALGGDGDELLAAMTVGLETTTRLCRALDYPRLRERGWHSPGVVGPVGAAAACARLLRLDADGVLSAMAHGAAQAAGTFAGLGTEAVKFNQARGAVAGLLAALAARAGLAASRRWLTDPDGGLDGAYSGGGEPELLVRGLGRDWELERISLRRWPAASSVQSLIEVCLDLGVGPDDVEAVAVELSLRGYEVSGDRGWETPLAAQQSARWIVAATLHDGDWWLEQSERPRIDDPILAAWAERVMVRPSEDVSGGGVRARFRLRDGTERIEERADAPGDPERPLSRADVEAKLQRAEAAACAA